MKFTFPPESRVLDGYTIKRAIYRGGFGEVYYALSDAGREVALKLLQNNTEIELRGVQQCLNLSHPNLVTIFDVREDLDGDHWIIMEYVGGETLDAAVRRHPDGMPMEQVRKWLPGLVAGVAYLHSRGLVHRDLKPANVFSDDGVVKVGDVGLSKFISPSRRSAQTQSVGTVYYMAPEVAKGKYGKEVDTYALGVMIYEMLTGRVPFDGESTGEILMKHLSEAPDLSKLPPRLRPVIGKSLEKDPAKRFHSIEAFEAAFNAAVLGRTAPLDIPEDAFVQPRERSVSYVDDVRFLAETSPGETVDFASQPWHRRAAPSSRGWWWIVGLGLLFLVMSGESGGMGLGYLLMGLGFGYVTYASPRVFARREWRFDRTSHRRRPQATAPPRPIVPPNLGGASKPAGANAVHPRLVSAPQAHGFRSLAMSPLARRTRFAHWLTSAALSALLVCGFTAGIAALAPSLLAIGGQTDFAPEAAAFFAAAALAGAWLVSFAVKATETRHCREEEGSGSRRLALIAAGLLTGAAAWGVSDFLAVDAGRLFASQEFDAVFTSVGERPLATSLSLVSPGAPRDPFPTLLGYMVFFGGLFGLRGWWRHVELFRTNRFSISSVLFTVLVAWLWSSIFVFPQTWAMLWAATISATVQLASPWSPRQQVQVRAKGR